MKLTGIKEGIPGIKGRDTVVLFATKGIEQMQIEMLEGLGYTVTVSE